MTRSPLTVTPDPEILELGRRLARQEEGAFDELMELTFDGLYRKIRVLLGRKGEAEDVLQEVLLRAFQARGQFRGGNPRAWLYRIAYHHCIDVLRRRLRTPATEPFDDRPDLGLTDRPPDPDFPEFLLGLTAAQREVLVMRAVDGLTYAEIAEITGLAEGTLRNLVSKTVRDLRTNLGGKAAGERSAPDGEG